MTPPFPPNPPTGNHPPEDVGLAPDLVALAASLDQLAAAERGEAGAAFEDRLFVASRASLPAAVPAEIVGVADRLDDLARVERGGAPVSLEDRLMLATAGVLRGAGRTVAAAAPVARPEVVVATISWRRMVWRAAAAIAIVGGSAAVWTSLRPGVIPNGGGVDPMVRVVQVRRDLDELSRLAEQPSPIAAFDDLHRDLDSIASTLGGSWFRSDGGSDEESL